jgi:SpoVK/Ycf46/Vps4 family AAA+-type ATPase
MENIPMNSILERESIIKEITEILRTFDERCQLTTFKKGIYIYGSPGTGKSHFVVELLKQLDYDAIIYDAGDVRNKSLFQTIDSNNLSNRNVLDLMKRKIKKIAIVMDEIDGMNNGDKGGIDALIKLIRQKKTKKQKAENTTLNPIICIGNHKNDKKIRELMKACHTFELKIPTYTQIHSILQLSLPPFPTFPEELQQKIHEYIQGDLRKLLFLCQIWKKKPELLTFETIQNIFHVKMFNEDAKKITWRLINNTIPLEDHTLFMNETDRTTVALLWHENIANPLSLEPKHKSLPFYSKLLENMCFADYIGRITFQSQIWQFNEMGSLIKTFYNNRLYHDEFPNHSGKFALADVDFTKVLTKYSTEYNNQLFLHGLCQKLNMDKNDLVSFFQELRILYSVSSTAYIKSSKINKNTNTEWMTKVEDYLAKDSVDLLDIKRMYRFLDKNVKKEDDLEEYENNADDVENDDSIDGDEIDFY